MLISFPFLFFLLIKSAKNKIIYKIIIPFVLLGAFINLIGLQESYDDSLKDIENNSLMKEEFKSRFNNLELFPNILNDYYLREFSKTGVHSFVINSLTQKGFVDIRLETG